MYIYNKDTSSWYTCLHHFGGCCYQFLKQPGPSLLKHFQCPMLPQMVRSECSNNKTTIVLFQETVKMEKVITIISAAKTFHWLPYRLARLKQRLASIRARSVRMKGPYLVQPAITFASVCVESYHSPWNKGRMIKERKGKENWKNKVVLGCWYIASGWGPARWEGHAEQLLQWSDQERPTTTSCPHM